MKKSMCITYIVDGKLYVNVTNRCSNRCEFCIRNNGDGAYGSDSLWLSHEPSIDEVLDSVFSHNLENYSEVVFCGYGEPSCRLSVVRDVAISIKEKYPHVKIRINTNGQSDLIYKCDTAPMYEGVFDSVSISLNAPTPEKYQSICHSVFGNSVLEAILIFTANVKKYVSEVKLSVVRDFLSEEEISECKKLAESCGVPLRIREYISA